MSFLLPLPIVGASLCHANRLPNAKTMDGKPDTSLHIEHGENLAGQQKNRLRQVRLAGGLHLVLLPRVHYHQEVHRPTLSDHLPLQDCSDTAMVDRTGFLGRSGAPDCI